MAQVMNPYVKPDDSLNNIMAGLSIYSTVSNLRTKAMEDKMNKASMSANPNDAMNNIEAMQRRSRVYSNPQTGTME